MLCSTIFSTVSSKLQDTSDPRRWQWDNVDPSKSSLVEYLNNAIMQIATHRPDAVSKTMPLALAPGFKQSLPTGVSSVINILYNIGANGSIGKPVRQTKFKSIIALPPAEGYYVDCYAYDKLDDMRTLWVYPHVPANGLEVMATLSMIPTPVASSADTFPLSYEFISPAVHWILYEIYSGDNNDTDLVRAEHQYQAFLTEVGATLKSAATFPVKPKEGNV